MIKDDEVRKTIEKWLCNEDALKYQLLSRMKSDCDYYLGNGNRYKKHLWAGDEADQIESMKVLWNSFKENRKPEWLTMQQIEDYEKQMINVVSAIITDGSSDIVIQGHVGKWYVIDSQEFNGEQLYLLEHCEYGDEAACIIVDGNGHVKLDDVWNGFNDYEDFLIIV